jgi:hypothetical protein
MHAQIKFVSFALLTWTSTCYGVEPYVARFTTEPIKIDGLINEPAWDRAAKITDFKLFSPVNVEKLPQTTAKLLWDKDYLYVAFECEDDDIWSFSDKNDDPLYSGDVVELFVKPSRNSLQYYEFVVAPNGAIYDARYPSRGAGLSHRFGKWNSEAKIATKINGTNDNHHDSDQGYAVEMAIPLTAFESRENPENGTEWTFGVFRYDFSKSFEDCLMLMSLPEAASNHGFHHYEAYQPLQFED